MGRPHPTVEVPGEWPAIAVELGELVHPDDVSAELLRGLRGDDVRGPGHVCATAWVLSPDGRHVLLVRHRRLGWSTPGGHLSPGETSLAAATRELAEECGASVAEAARVHPRPVFVHLTSPDGTSDAHTHWNVAWAFDLDGDPAPDGEEESRWWPCDALPDGPDDMSSGLERIVVTLRP